MAAPMTSRNQTITSMVTVVAEGRCTLMATYQIFQFIIGYALVQVRDAGWRGREDRPQDGRGFGGTAQFQHDANRHAKVVYVHFCL